MKRLLILAFTLFGAKPGGACDCVLTPVEQHIRRTPYLLTGQVLAILDGNSAAGREYRKFRLAINPREDTAARGYTARLRVDQCFKGSYRANEIITIDSDFSNCALPFEIGKKYVLFLHKEKQALFTTPCSYSESLSAALYPADLMARIYSATRPAKH